MQEINFGLMKDFSTIWLTSVSYTKRIWSSKERKSWLETLVSVSSSRNPLSEKNAVFLVWCSPPLSSANSNLPSENRGFTSLTLVIRASAFNNIFQLVNNLVGMKKCLLSTLCDITKGHIWKLRWTIPTLPLPWESIGAAYRVQYSYFHTFAFFLREIDR